MNVYSTDEYSILGDQEVILVTSIFVVVQKCYLKKIFLFLR